MIKLLYGTTNKAKISSMVNSLKSINVTLLNNDSFDLSVVKVVENGDTPIDNAKIKALAFYKKFKIPVFSCDSGLYFKNVDDKYQPNVKVRRVNDKHLNDEEMIEYYASLAKMHGGELISYYKNSICLAMGEDEMYCYDGHKIHSEEFVISSIPHKSRTNGLPLDSLSIHIESGKYYMDIKKDLSHAYALKKDLSNGFCDFFIENIKGVHRLNV